MSVSPATVDPDLTVDTLAARARELYVTGDHAAAAQAFSEALDAVPPRSALQDADTLATLYANRAAARLRDSAALAAHDAALSLSLQPASWRSRLRLANALASLERGAEANHQAACVLRLPNLPPHIAREASSLLRRTDALAAAAVTSATEARHRMVQRSQILRVHLCSPLPTALRCGRWHTLQVRLSNEMGLFDADCFAEEAEALVRLQAIELCSEDPRSLRLTVRQAAQPVPPPELKASNLPALDCSHDPAAIRLHRGRATAEVYVAVTNGVVSEGSDALLAAPPLVVLRADLHVPSATEGRRALGAMSLPIPLLLARPPLGGLEQARPSEALPAAPPVAEYASSRALVVEALQPLLTISTDGAAGEAASSLDALVQGFRLLQQPGSRSALPLVLAESTSGIAGRLWDSGLQLAAWLGEGGLLDQRQRVIELGSGVGVAGLAAAALGARVLLTDLDEALDLLRLNAKANAHHCLHQPAVAALEWGVADDELLAALAKQPHGEPPDCEQGGEEGEEPSSILLASDIVYEPLAYEPLLDTMRRLAALGVATRMIMAHRSRHPDEHLFFDSAARDFSITLLRGPPFAPLGSAHLLGANEGAVATDQAVIRLLQFDAIV